MISFVVINLNLFQYTMLWILWPQEFGFSRFYLIELLHALIESYQFFDWQTPVLNSSTKSTVSRPIFLMQRYF